MRRTSLVVLSAFFAWFVSACGDGASLNDSLSPGQTDFVNEQPGGGDDYQGRGIDGPMAAGGTELDSSSAAPKAEPPSGRTAEVEEADIYRVDANRLFYLNTYRGFLIYDLNDPKKPKRMGRLPVFGYPIEMFVQGNVVYALLRDALYLSQKKGTLQFERNNVSQLVAIDVSDLAHPKVLQKVDIIGELREGVSRKLDDTIYVVSYLPQNYYWGWNYRRPAEQKEQAWVYSFNVQNPQQMTLVEKLKIFEGGSFAFYDKQTGFSGTRYFQGVAISATSNALMVVENWQRSFSSRPSDVTRCYSYSYDQQAVVSLIDISDPSGKINRHTTFSTSGQLGDQFKMTYRYDPAAKTGTFFGIFARMEWSNANCDGQRVVMNTLESWDVTDGANPQLLDSLSFGKPNETVRGSAYDLSRDVAYAITARAIDPLYVISLADRKNLKVLSAIDGLSGDMNLFRLVANNQYLMGIGRDNTTTCTGFQGSESRRATNVAVSLIDVKNLNAIRLVQRQCVAVDNASWINSAVNFDLDQAHKLIGMYSDSRANVLTVPVFYYKKEGPEDWWWYRYETAVGMMTWDVTKDDPSKSERDQSVLTNFGTVVHSHGQVRRSVIFTHSGATARRMMINLSDTHLAITDIDDLAKPQALSTVEIAPYYDQIFRFGQYVVEHIRPSRYNYWDNQGQSEFRVKAVSSNIEEQNVVASFSVGQVQRVVKHGNKLVLYRLLPRVDNGNGYYDRDTELLVYDLSTPTAPQRGGSLKLSGATMPYYLYWCGARGYWGGYWFGSNSNWTMTDTSLVMLGYMYDPVASRYEQRLMLIDLTNPAQPTLVEHKLSSGTNGNIAVTGLVADVLDPSSFLLTYRTQVGTRNVGRYTVSVFKHFAQRWVPTNGHYAAAYAVNLPGQLVRTWKSENGTRLFLTADSRYRLMLANSGQNTYWRSDSRLNLLREISLFGTPVAELRDTRTFVDFHVGGLVLEGTRLYLNARRAWYYAYEAVDDSDGAAQNPDPSDHLQIFDLSSSRLAQTFGGSLGTQGVYLMGADSGRLFLNLPGDGIVVIDASTPHSPKALSFTRTLGFATHIEVDQNRAYVASGHFGVFEVNLAGPTLIPQI
ncbi:MAG: beta-propeller domain-containing protein [Deltaproteobacteria bacterium]|nr:beta-propeller domain-containing protein [Deltaproteobacteria bacterium]